MKTFLLLVTGLLLVFTSTAFSQGDDCTNPVLVNVICPEVTLTNETTSGFSNDVSVWKSFYNNYGNDKVYAVTLPAWATNLVISITKLSAPLYLYFSTGACANTNPTMKYVSTPIENEKFVVAGGGTYYLWIDHANASDITYDISFGVYTTPIFVNIPDTRGDWRFSPNYCFFPSTKEHLELSWNGVHQDFPLTYTPLNVPGVVCSKFVLQNMHGEEGVKKVEFVFDEDITNFSPTVTSMPGYYNAGTWNATTSGNRVTWVFTDAAGLGYGDFTGIPSGCLSYEFCFNITPVSNDPETTNIIATFYPDGRGAGYTGYVYDGCCASAGNCYAGGPGNSTGAISAGFNDPPTLPVIFAYVKAINSGSSTIIEWRTEREEKVASFIIQRSTDKHNFEDIANVLPASNYGNSSTYKFRDISSTTEAYYRIIEVDLNGEKTISQIVRTSGTLEFTIYPNPVKDQFLVSSSVPVTKMILYNSRGEQYMEFEGFEGEAEVSVVSCLAGIYSLAIYTENKVYTERVVID